MSVKSDAKSKKLVERGRFVILPIVGDECSEIRVGLHRLAKIIFRDAAGGESQLELEEAGTLVRRDMEVQLEGSRPGVTWNPSELKPLLDLLGSTVLDARASSNGRLEIEFTHKWLLRVDPDTGYEAWHFQFPRTGEQPGGTTANVVSLHGADGYLI